jgi:iron complex transport system ATP-binding protein
MLSVRNVTIKYENCEILQNVSFKLESGQILAVLGENGAGKTTLLKSLNGGLPIAAGEILLDEKTLKEYSRREISRKISVVAQETETKFPIKVLEFVLAGRFANGGVFGWESKQDLQIAQNALANCDLKDFEPRLMNELSGGERQRVVFARALATEAKILLLDEPTANLDLAHQALLFRLVREKCDAGNFSAVVVTHDLNLAAAFADEVLLLKNGGILAIGKPETVLKTETLREVFQTELLVDAHPASRKPRITINYRQ